MMYDYSKDPNEDEPIEENGPVEEVKNYSAPQNSPVEEIDNYSAPESAPVEEIDNYPVEEVKGQYVEEIGGQYVYVEEYNNPYNYSNPARFNPTPPPVQPKNKPKLKKVLTGTSIGLFLMLLGMLSFVFVSMAGNTATGAATVPAVSSSNSVMLVANPTTSSATVQSTVTAPVLTVQAIVQKVTPAVVQITSQQTVTARPSRTAIGSTSGSSTTQATGVGTGIIYDAAGYILTNNHVVAGANSLLVTLTDGRTFQGTVVGTDPQTDLAVVKINATNLTVATLGDSSALYVGDGLVAIGNALALPGGPTVTTGVVSALDRSVAEPAATTTASPYATAAASAGTQLYGLIQTDAAINPGNSGGPLINMAGEVIGINTLGAGTDQSGVQAEGIGFAISINQAKTIAAQLVANGKVSHANLGISSEPLTAAIASQLGVSITQGTVVDQVQSGSAAAQAGLKQADIITAIDGTRLTGESTLGQIINQHQPGDKVTLTVVSPASSGGTGVGRSVQVTLGTLSAS